MVSTVSLGQLFMDLADVNAALWRAEDKVRANDYADARMVKPEIDKLNQQRNDIIEAIDARVLELAQHHG
jgi:hypothetical protein